jgi:hypothetical protein
VSPAPGIVLRRALLLWGLGDHALGERTAATGWMLAELIGLGVVVAASLSLANSTWYLVPFVLGAAFIGLWGYQAVCAFQLATRRQSATPPTPRRSPAAAMAWLTVPILLWGTGFWLIGAEGVSPSAVLDRFVSDWPSLETETPAWPATFAADGAQLTDAGRSALIALEAECRAGTLTSDCDEATANLLRDVRVSVVSQTDTQATAIAELVDYRPQETSVLFFFHGSELVPVSRERLLQVDLRAMPVPILGLELGARRWQIADARPLGTP